MLKYFTYTFRVLDIYIIYVYVSIYICFKSSINSHLATYCLLPTKRHDLLKLRQCQYLEFFTTIISYYIVLPCYKTIGYKIKVKLLKLFTSFNIVIFSKKKLIFT